MKTSTENFGLDSDEIKRHSHTGPTPDMWYCNPRCTIRKRKPIHMNEWWNSLTKTETCIEHWLKEPTFIRWLVWWGNSCGQARNWNSTLKQTEVKARNWITGRIWMNDNYKLKNCPSVYFSWWPIAMQSCGFLRRRWKSAKEDQIPTQINYTTRDGTTIACRIQKWRW